jgi:adenylate kinase
MSTSNLRIVLFGAPGSGKGTQAILLSEYLNVHKISLGDILREEVKRQSPLGIKVSSYMEKGLLVPDEVVSEVIAAHLDNKGFLLDGYPRNINQAKNLEEILGIKHSAVDLFIYLDVDERTIVDRLSKRRVCKACGANYHLKNMPPKKDGICDACGAELVQRKDDTPSVIKKRWEIFTAESKKLLDFYQKNGKLIKVDGRGEKDEIFERIKGVL